MVGGFSVCMVAQRREFVPREDHYYSVAGGHLFVFAHASLGLLFWLMIELGGFSVDYLDFFAFSFPKDHALFSKCCP